ncbi:hypothetical protein PflCFBP13510_04090 [Pseudomonas fluorescens]|nr:hypothetical protein [Pseudomonas sp. L13]OWQ39628.1 hypothetical protein CDH05_20965 [Pseudomonas lactis]TKK14204.1 hypothetical protein PflCFBP13510_04090 [Pseudomonas fluorescens]
MARRSSRPSNTATVGASLLAKNSRSPRSSCMHALSLKSFASKLAPTGFGSAASPFSLYWIFP